MSDYISRADAMGAVQDHFNDDGFKGYDDGQKMMDRITALPSADRPTSDDLIIKNGKGIQDGLYNIHNGEIFKYKAKGGTVRTYKLVPSVSAERVGEWEYDFDKDDHYCTRCHKYAGDWEMNLLSDYCPSCGARMENTK